MKLVKKVFKNRFFIFITTALIFSVIGVSAATYFPSNDVTYDNTVSGLSSTDVQGAIDELYDVCSTPVTPLITVNDLTKNVVTVGDGLYKDEYENGRYFYRGTNPDNYITFNDEEWRILSINTNGTVKIIRTSSIGNRAFSRFDNWDEWSSSSLQTYLNGTYYNSLTDKDKIANSSFSVGGIDNDNLSLGLSETVSSENSSKWSGKIGLITVSEYIRANNNRTCYSISSHNSNNDICLSSNWIYYDGLIFWTLTPGNSGNGSIYYIYHFIGPSSSTADTKQVRPVINLVSSIKLRGLGTKENPYTIET